LNLRIIGAIIGYLIAAFCAMLLFRRGYDWRFKLLVSVVGLLPLYHAMTLMIRHGLWTVALEDWFGDAVELITAVVFLVVVLLLDLESTERRYVHARLRLAEAEAGWPQSMDRRRLREWFRDLLGRKPAGDKRSGKGCEGTGAWPGARHRP